MIRSPVSADGRIALYNGLVTNFFFALFLFCAVKAATTRPGSPGAEWREKSTALAEAKLKKTKDTAMCRKCNQKACQTYKPDRTHHCSKLGVCVLRMDHYCPWINNTLGYYNMKYFFLTL